MGNWNLLTLKQKWHVVRHYTWSDLNRTSKIALAIDYIGVFAIMFAIAYTANAYFTGTIW